MRLPIHVLLIMVLVSACAENPTKEYDTLLASPTEGGANGVAEAVKNVPATTLVKSNRVRFKIDSNDPVINLDGIRSFYKVFEITGVKDKSIEIKTISHIKTTLAGGLGPIYVVWPRVFILDETGKILSDAMEDGKTSRAAYGMGPMQYEATWKAEIPQSGKYYVLVTSDNRVLDKEVASEGTILPAGGNIFVPWKFGLRAHSSGAMTISWEN